MKAGYRLACLAATAFLGFVAPRAKAADPVTVTVWSWSPVAPTMKEMVAAIERKHPDNRVLATVQPITAYLTATKMEIAA